MTKIGIFGDSFGCQSTTIGMGDPNLGMEHHWASLFALDLGAQLGIEAVSGSSLFYSCNKFLENHSLYDIVIFIVTDSGRYPVPIYKNQFVTGLDHMNAIRDIIDLDYSEEFARAEKWFESAPKSYLITVADLMIEKVKQIRPDAIIIPVCEHSMSPQKFVEFGLGIKNTLIEIYYEQMAQLDISANSMNVTRIENPIYIAGHFVPEIHEFFYDILKKKYTTGKWVWRKVPRLKFKHGSGEYCPFINKGE